MNVHSKHHISWSLSWNWNNSKSNLVKTVGNMGYKFFRLFCIFSINIGLKTISGVVIMQSWLHYLWKLYSFRIYFSKTLYFGIGIYVYSENMLFDQILVGLYFEVNIVSSRLDLQKSITTLVISLYVLSIIIRKSFEFSIVLSFLSLSHEVLDIWVSSWCFTILIDHFAWIPRQIDVQIYKAVCFDNHFKDMILPRVFVFDCNRIFNQISC